MWIFKGRHHANNNKYGDGDGSRGQHEDASDCDNNTENRDHHPDGSEGDNDASDNDGEGHRRTAERKKGFIANAFRKVRSKVQAFKSKASKIERETDEVMAMPSGQEAKAMIVEEAGEFGEPIVALELYVIEGRNMKSTKKAHITVTVEGKSLQTETVSGEAPRWHCQHVNETPPPPPFKFGVTDITGDINLTVHDYHRKVGRVIIPIRWLYTVTSKNPGLKWKGFDTWLKILPMPMKEALKDTVTQRIAGIKAEGANEAEENKFYPALAKEKGTGLPDPDPDSPLGEIHLKIRAHALYQSQGLVALSYLRPIRSLATEVRWKDVDKDAREYLEDEKNDKVLNFEGLMRIIDRIKLLIKGPPLFLKPPFSLATIVWLYIFCFKTSASQIPWVMFGLVTIEGVCLWLNRDPSKILIWESQVEKKEKKGLLELGGVLKKLLQTIGAYQHKIGLIVSTLERLKNVISFGDTIASLLFYAVLCFLCLVAQVVMALMPPGLPWFVVGLAILAPPYVKLHKRYMGETKISNLEKKKHPDLIDRIRMNLLTFSENFLNHIPDQQEMVHRYICDQQIIV
mmetsp:Transcript_5186/g.12590  ORF Transcript_5186/g.12590 Transcript_5186/m.12590 type:complete len:571 (-) Transcript_5186:169-1881(-)